MRIILTTERLNELKCYLTSKVSPDGMDKEARRRFKLLASKFTLINGVVCSPKGDGEFLEAIADDDTDRLHSVISQMHLPGHRGIKSMYMFSLGRYVGFKRKRINEYVRGCEACQRERPLQRVQAIRPIISDRPWQHIQADLIDMRNYANDNDGFSWTHNIIDLYSKYCHYFPLKAANG